MAERVYPASRAPGAGAKTINGGGAAANPNFPATKAQLYGAGRPAYRPQPPPRRRRSCCCSCCLWLTLFVFALLLLAAVAGAIFWALYRPQRPRFTVSSFRISQFNVTSSHLNFKSNLAVTAYNPNEKLQFNYDPMILSVDSNGIPVGTGSFPPLVHGAKNVTVLKSAITSSGQDLDDGSVTSIKSDLKGKGGLPLTVQLETKVGVKIGAMKTKKVKVRVSCDGIRSTAPTGKTAATAATSGAKCKVDLRVKIWRWTF